MAPSFRRASCLLWIVSGGKGGKQVSAQQEEIGRRTSWTAGTEEAVDGSDQAA